MTQKKGTPQKTAPKKAEGSATLKPTNQLKETLKGSKKGQLIEGLVIHCSASNFYKHDNAETVDRWHKARGWKGIGYHWFIRSDGKLETGRPIDSDPYLESDEIGAHVLGENRRLLGVCLHGIDHNDFTKEQLETLENLFKKEILSRNPKAILYGHNHFTDKKTCPNFDWMTWGYARFPDNTPPKEGK